MRISINWKNLMNTNYRYWRGKVGTLALSLSIMSLFNIAFNGKIIQILNGITFFIGFVIFLMISKVEQKEIAILQRIQRGKEK